jgi:exosortase C (VPDSG-CTERM-specific)
LSAPPSIPDSFRRRLRVFGISSLVLLGGFAPVLIHWFSFSLHSELFSYLLLIPLVSGFLIHLRLRGLSFTYTPAFAVVILLAAPALALLLASFILTLPHDEALSLRIAAFVLLWIAAAVGILGGQTMARLAFPAAFLLFITPLPAPVVGHLETGLQHASAEAASSLFRLVGIPNFRTDLTFQLPNITMQVAPECSGIRSTLVLFIISLVAGHLLLDHPWQRVLFTLLVIPLGILRNAFRIVTLGWLCTHYGSAMIHSAIHHRGGPVFFALSLVPLFVVLLLFRSLARNPARVPA